jgi:hypothetical protein
MTTSHLCGGKWKPGPIEECSKHRRLSKKQPSVYRSRDDGAPSSGSGSDRSGSSGGSKRDSG